MFFLTFSPWSFLGHAVTQAHMELFIAEHRMKIRYITNITKNVFEGHSNYFTKKTDKSQFQTTEKPVSSVCKGKKKYS